MYVLIYIFIVTFYLFVLLTAFISLVFTTKMYICTDLTFSCVCFVQDEGTFQMKPEPREFLARMGSKAAKDLHYRDMWAFVTVHGGESHFIQQNLNKIKRSVIQTTPYLDWSTVKSLGTPLYLIMYKKVI